ncbi:MBL fold metallo-hydrolase [Streptomyces sp. NPDC059853]|uniref:MBL fold metallo-hydrolase n=1 Tax=Streptomyces sp. NPDC059853 TaxID=3346973 RepID=UPI003667636F
METSWEELAAGVLRTRLPGWDETVGAIAGPRGVLLIDAGPSPAAAGRIRAGLRALLGLPVRWVVLTHPHFDHALGAGGYPGARVYGTLGDPLELAADAVRHGMPEREAADGVAALSGVRPRPVTGKVSLYLGGGRTVSLAPFGPAHTPYDVAVKVDRTVFTGDLVEESGEPQAGRDADLAAWPGALDRLLAWGGPDARYVPGHGAVVDAAFVAAQRASLAARAGAQ